MNNSHFKTPRKGEICNGAELECNQPDLESYKVYALRQDKRNMHQEQYVLSILVFSCMLRFAECYRFTF